MARGTILPECHFVLGERMQDSAEVLLGMRTPTKRPRAVRLIHGSKAATLVSDHLPSHRLHHFALHANSSARFPVWHVMLHVNDPIYSLTTEPRIAVPATVDAFLREIHWCSSNAAGPLHREMSDPCCACAWHGKDV